MSAAPARDRPANGLRPSLRAGSRASLDTDFARPGALELRLRSAHGQHAVLIVGADPIGVDVAGQQRLVSEAPGHALLGPKQPGALALLSLTRDDYAPSPDLDRRVLTADARELDLDDVGIVGVLDVSERSEDSRP